MFLRTVKVKRPGGRVDEYIRLVESVWHQGRPEHRVVANLGRKDLLAPHADTLLRMLTGAEAPAAPATRVDAVGAWDWGSVLVARQLWRAVRVGEAPGGGGPGPGARADRALGLVARRWGGAPRRHGTVREV